LKFSGKSVRWNDVQSIVICFNIKRQIQEISSEATCILGYTVLEKFDKIPIAWGNNRGKYVSTEYF